MVWYRALKFVTHLEYEYAQVAVDLFCENVTLVHFSVVVCNYFSPFFLYRKECVIISKFESTVLCGLTRETRLTRHKSIAWCTHLLDRMKCSTFDGEPFTRWSHEPWNWSTALENSCFSITRAAGLLDKVYNSLKLRPHNFLINCVRVSVYCHLKSSKWKIHCTLLCMHKIFCSQSVHPNCFNHSREVNLK